MAAKEGGRATEGYSVAADGTLAYRRPRFQDEPRKEPILGHSDRSALGQSEALARDEKDEGWNKASCSKLT